MHDKLTLYPVPGRKRKKVALSAVYEHRCHRLAARQLGSCYARIVYSLQHCVYCSAVHTVVHTGG